ncbi:MAG: hypothetical protein V9G23_16805 [Giesbergeria sp.]
MVHNYGNIECRDAVLAWDAQEPAYDKAGQLLTRWDGRTFKTHPVTGEPVPDEAAQVPQWRYVGARQAAWPQADFIVGNPPFIGAASMRAALGDGYVLALRGAWPEVPESADFVMFWWHHAAAASRVRAGAAHGADYDEQLAADVQPAGGAGGVVGFLCCSIAGMRWRAPMAGVPSAS